MRIFLKYFLIFILMAIVEYIEIVKGGNTVSLMVRPCSDRSIQPGHH